jgi:hypothetical protein
VNIANRLKTSRRRWELRWSDAPTELIVAGMVALVGLLMFVLALGGMCEALR